MVIFFTVLICLGVTLRLIGLVCLIIFQNKKVPQLAYNREKNPAPGISILKICFDVKDGELENFETFYQQNYPGPYEIIYLVSSESDPVFPVIQHFLKKYPHFSQRLVISKTRKALWNKVNALIDGMEVARFPIVLLSDSDAFVQPEYLSQKLAFLEKPEVGLVSEPQYDFGANTPASGMKIVGNNPDVSTLYMLYVVLSPNNYLGVNGHSVLFRKKDLVDMGPTAIDFLCKYFADDQALGILFHRAGKKIEYAPISSPVRYQNKTFKEAFIQKRRWSVNQRIGVKNDLVYFSGIFYSYPLLPALMLFLWELSWPSFVVLISVFAFRIVCSLLTEWTLFRSLYGSIFGPIQLIFKYGWTQILWDLSQPYFILHGLRAQIVYYNKRPYRLSKDFLMEPITDTIASADL